MLIAARARTATNGTLPSSPCWRPLGESQQYPCRDHTALFHFLSVLDEGSMATAIQSLRNVAIYGANGSPSAV
jgi:hypothetical protein